MKLILITAMFRVFRNQSESMIKPWTCREEASIAILKTMLVATIKPTKPEWTSKGCSRTLSYHLWSMQWARRIIFSKGNLHTSIRNQMSLIVKAHLIFIKLNLLNFIVLNHNLTPRSWVRKYLKNQKLWVFAVTRQFLINTKITCKCDLFKHSALQQSSPIFWSKSWVKTAVRKATRWNKSK